VVLIHAGGSGVGSAAIQIAKFAGARVITTSGSETKLEKALELGAEFALDYRDKEWPKEVKKKTEGKGVDVVFEHVGLETFGHSLRLLRKGGRLVTCGATSGSEVPIDLKPIFFKGISILGSTMGSRSEMETLFKLLGQKAFRPVVDRVLPLDEIGKAHTLIEGRALFGKVVLAVNE
jgi:NADPH:quinone reductase-like Zn-dependent oxidoreductase